MKKFSVVFLVALLIVVAGTFLMRDVSNVNANPSVAATLFPVADLAQSIVPDGVDVHTLLPAGASPHTFEPSPAMIKRVQNASVVYAIGHGIDDWVSSVAKAAGTEVVVLDENVELLELEEEDDHGHDHGHSHGHGDVDPHYWLHPENAVAMLHQMGADLSDRFPEQKDIILERTNLFSQTLETVYQELRADIRKREDAKIVTLHDAWNYFADAFDLTIIGTFEPSPGREPSPAHLAELSEAIQQTNVRVLYSEPQLSVEGLKTFANDTGVSFVELDPIGGIEPRTSYIGLMRFNVEQLLKTE